MTSDETKSRSLRLSSAHVDLADFGDEAKHIGLIRRRADHLGGSLLFYHDPINIVRGEGVYLFDDEGRQYLDCYNNVASVGHCHPDVVRALTDQISTLNTHTRYLHESVVAYAEELVAKMPEGLDVCFFVCTGSEANDLALRMARSYTGANGVIVMDGSYHGNTQLAGEASTATYPANLRPSYIEVVEPPNTYRGSFRLGEESEPGKRYADLVDDAIAALKARGERTAAFLCDCIFDSQGALEAPSDYFTHVYEKIRAAGGLCIADEVQAGLCRTGTWWGFENFDVVPDIVTIGKPLGDGHPLAVVIARREIADAFNKTNFYFNTFGGNPVSMAAGRAVLRLCDEQALNENVRVTGAYLRAGLEALSQKYELIGDVRGLGLFQSVELVLDRETRKPATQIVGQIPDKMKEQGVLIGSTGKYGNALKLRPPLTFSQANADQLLKALDQVLEDVSRQVK